MRAGGGDPTLFDPDPDLERWISRTGTAEDKERIRMQERCMVPCGKGSGSCLGQAMVTAELYSTMGDILWRFDVLGMVVEEE